MFTVYCYTIMVGRGEAWLCMFICLAEFEVWCLFAPRVTDVREMTAQCGLAMAEISAASQHGHPPTTVIPQPLRDADCTPACQTSLSSTDWLTALLNICDVRQLVE